MEFNEQSCSSPAPRSSTFLDSSSLLRDVSNLTTPRSLAPAKNFATPMPTSRFFTAAKQTPRSYSSVRHNPHRPSANSKRKTATARRIKVFELEQSQSSRKAQIGKEMSLKSLAKSLTTWLNFLFQNPTACGCDSPLEEGLDEGAVALGKREGRRRPGNDGSLEVNATWRCPKRRRDSMWGGGDGAEIKEHRVVSISKNYPKLKSSLDNVCSLDDLLQRMRLYLSLSSCKEIFDIMTLVVKSIDNGRLQMKSHCPIVTDFGMKEKATRILMCYNPIWLRIGLHIIFGGDTLLPSGDVSSEQELAFLKTMIDKQFFSHAGLAKAYAYNKMVDGLYRPGYYESLGNIILKRFLLLVLTLDRAKSQSALPLEYGIDGIDGGSPLLFEVQSNIKSSAQVVNDYLSPEVMHGEGNLLAHLVIIGYKVSYQQSLLVEYEFRVTDLFADFQDGMRLCRAIQLLQNDSSILLKMVYPSDSRKKRLTTNCGIALKWLKNSGVNLFDEDGIEITEDDIATGDKELTISLLWNMFVHLQLPLLVNKTILLEETLGIRGTHTELSSNITTGSSPLELLLDWLKAVCAKYDHIIENFFSLVDGRAIWCLLDYYFRKELSCSQSLKDPCSGTHKASIMSASDYTDTVHNFILSQKLATLLGSFPEVLHTSELLEHSGAISDRSVIILVVFLSSQLTAKKAVDQLNFHKLLGCNCQSLVRRHSRVEKSFIASQVELNQEQMHGHSIDVCVDAASKFKFIRAWWQDMAERNREFVEASMVTESWPTGTLSVESGKAKWENAAIVIQSKFRKFKEHQKYVRVINAISLLQTMLRAWLLAKKKMASLEVAAITVQGLALVNPAGREKQPEQVMQHVKFFVDRHNFNKLRRSVMIIQKEARIWMTKYHKRISIASGDSVSSCARISAAVVIQKHTRGLVTRSRYKVVQKEKELQLAATKVQRHIRSWLLRRRFLNLRQATTRIQQYYRCLRCLRVFQQHRTTQSAISIQSFVRGWLACREIERRKYHLRVLQKYIRGWLIRKHFLCKKQAATKIQSAIRCLNCCKALRAQEVSAIEIQRFVRGRMTRRRLLGASFGTYAASTVSRDCLWSSQLHFVMSSILKLQRWWKNVLLHKLRTKAAILIQSHVRGWITKKRTSRKRRHVTIIQSHWRGYLARKESKGQLLDLRWRMQKSARNVDDRMRIINKLKVAVSELLSMKSMSNVLHICQTLDRTTQHSQRCCEELVGAGAIGMLLKLMRSVSRSIPDQEVLKHALSTLRNLARYPHLVEALVDSGGSVDAIFLEFLRNKEEGYFIAAEVIRKMWLNNKGMELVCRSPALLKRLDTHVEEMKRKKSSSEMRNRRGVAAETRRDVEKRRLREAAELLKLVSSKS